MHIHFIHPKAEDRLVIQPASPCSKLLPASPGSDPPEHGPQASPGFSLLHQALSHSQALQSTGSYPIVEGRIFNAKQQRDKCAAKYFLEMEIVLSVASHRSLSPFCLHKPLCIASGSVRSKRTSPGPVPVQRRSKTEALQLLKFEREGHICVPGLFDGAEMSALAGAVNEAARLEKLNAYRHRVAVLCPGVDPFSLHSIADAEAVIRQQGTDELGFLQCFNLHQKSQLVRQWASHRRLVAMVAELLGARKVRLYQDCLFQKMPGFGVTNWHSDLNMVPLDTNSFLTVWIPLRSLGKTDSSLHFASGSHRDFALAYWQNNQGMASLETRGYPVADYPCMTLGDVSIHHGWTLHWAPGQPERGPDRLAWTVSYFADGARVLDSRHLRRKLQEEDGWSYQAWRKDLKEGQVARHPLLPLVHPMPRESQRKG